jgi:hypothetical protein
MCDILTKSAWFLYLQIFNLNYLKNEKYLNTKCTYYPRGINIKKTREFILHYRYMTKTSCRLFHISNHKSSTLIRPIYLARLSIKDVGFYRLCSCAVKKKKNVTLFLVNIPIDYLGIYIVLPPTPKYSFRCY